MKIEKDFESTRLGIMEAAKLVFANYGYTKTSMDDISKATGKSRSSIYHYFSNKKEVFEAVATQDFQKTINEAQALISPTFSLEKNLSRYYLKKLKKIKGNLKKSQKFITEIREQKDLSCRLNRLLIDEEAQIMKNCLTWAIQNGEIAALSEEDLSFLSNLIITALRGFEEEMIVFNTIDDYERRVEWLLSILIKGLK